MKEILLRKGIRYFKRNYNERFREPFSSAFQDLPTEDLEQRQNPFPKGFDERDLTKERVSFFQDNNWYILNERFREPFHLRSEISLRKIWNNGKTIFQRDSMKEILLRKDFRYFKRIDDERFREPLPSKFRDLPIGRSGTTATKAKDPAQRKQRKYY